jgi:hypothetical protein
LEDVVEVEVQYVDVLLAKFFVGQIRKVIQMYAASVSILDQAEIIVGNIVMSLRKKA